MNITTSCNLPAGWAKCILLLLLLLLIVILCRSCIPSSLLRRCQTLARVNHSSSVFTTTCLGDSAIWRPSTGSTLRRRSLKCRAKPSLRSHWPAAECQLTRRLRPSERRGSINWCLTAPIRLTSASLVCWILISGTGVSISLSWRSQIPFILLVPSFSPFPSPFPLQWIALHFQQAWAVYGFIFVIMLASWYRKWSCQQSAVELLRLRLQTSGTDCQLTSSLQIHCQLFVDCWNVFYSANHIRMLVIWYHPISGPCSGCATKNWWIDWLIDWFGSDVCFSVFNEWIMKKCVLLSLLV